NRTITRTNTFFFSTLGAFGILIGAIIVLIHLASLKSFHTPYLYPIAPFNFNDLKDVFIRKHFKSKKNIRSYPNK
ncbi:MAG: spore germination protein, partial [Clostridia bacterium]|nr:spore germination protein [Clostridia bacterium]